MTLDHEQIIQGRFIDFPRPAGSRVTALVVAVRADYMR